jgi:hypothetical protein
MFSVLFGLSRVPSKLFFSPCGFRDRAIRHRIIMRMIISTQKIQPILIPAIAAALRVLLETDGCEVGDTSALIVVIVLEVVERAFVDAVVDKMEVVVREESSRVEAAGTNGDGTEDTPDTSVVITVANRAVVVVAAAVVAVATGGTVSGVTVAPDMLMLRVIPTDSHRLWANWRAPEKYFSYLVNYEVGVLIDILAMSAGEQTAAIAASSDSRKGESSQIHAISVILQPVDPRAEIAVSS